MKSQQKAVQAAFENQISVVQGPPGTGKTQTILNIIANILVRGKTVQIVSNNNSAIVNVLEKLSKYDMGFIVALLGSTANKEKNNIRRTLSHGMMRMPTNLNFSIRYIIRPKN